LNAAAVMKKDARTGGGPAMWRRVGTPQQGFSYHKADDTPLRSPGALKRIESLVIPPAWVNVEISPRAGAKVQAVGHDAAGRRQYIYHPDFLERNARRKYRKLLAFARVLPRLREETNAHLREEGLGRERVLATVVRLMTRAFFRVGSERYAVENKTFGLTTLQKKHLTIEGNDLFFQFTGKHGIHQRRVVAETPLVEIVRELMELPGRRLFRYRGEDGKLHNVSARDVNRYLVQILGEKYTSKDIRTWGGTVRAATILADLGPAQSEREAEKNLVLACKLVSSELGNTPTVCRSAYIHPLVLEEYLKGRTIAPVMRQSPRPVEAESPESYYPEEAALMRFLEATAE
jgi:DNA topoisomerase-1